MGIFGKKTNSRTIELELLESILAKGSVDKRKLKGLGFKEFNPTRVIDSDRQFIAKDFIKKGDELAEHLYLGAFIKTYMKTVGLGFDQNSSIRKGFFYNRKFVSSSGLEYEEWLSLSEDYSAVTHSMIGDDEDSQQVFSLYEEQMARFINNPNYGIMKEMQGGFVYPADCGNFILTDTIGSYGDQTVFFNTNLRLLSIKEMASVSLDMYEIKNMGKHSPAYQKWLV